MWSEKERLHAREGSPEREKWKMFAKVLVKREKE